MYGLNDDWWHKQADGIIKELSNPIHRDLFFAVIQHVGKEESFMYDFLTTEKLGFDQWAMYQHQLDEVLPQIDPNHVPDYRSMSVRYDEYLARDNHGRIDLNQSKRFDAIIAKFDDGWSGAMFGVIMRLVQAKLLKMINN